MSVLIIVVIIIIIISSSSSSSNSITIINIISSSMIITVTITINIISIAITHLIRPAEARAERPRGDGQRPSEQFWIYLSLNIAAPQTFARTFTKPGSRLY